MWHADTSRSETNSRTCDGAPGVSNTADIALWAVGYTLYDWIQATSLDRSIVDSSAVVGNTDMSQTFELSVGDTHVSGYAVFEGGELVRAVFVSGRAHRRGREQDGEHVRARLVIQHTDDTANVTWAGQSFEMASGTPSSGVVRETSDSRV
ncbi:hypothetical protein C8Q80DRAFT_603894 [Daedaleopsis nitida]|nr:hypothetical protein C8Q80DRAFT_603894 [Daedaleopsis nitida]